VATAQVVGGVAIQWSKTTKFGAVVLGIVYLFFALRWVPHIVAEPQVFDRWGNFFEQFSLVCGATIVYASMSSGQEWAKKLSHVGRILFGVCVVSFTLGQAVYLSDTADFVPKWLPPGQMFWAVTTTIAFALAAIAILSGLLALLASRLTAAMIVIFGLLVWLPRLIADPHSQLNWAGNAQNLAIAGAAWIVADYLGAVLRQ
jgi:hypothetical protein